MPVIDREDIVRRVRTEYDEPDHPVTAATIASVVDEIMELQPTTENLDLLVQAVTSLYDLAAAEEWNSEPIVMLSQGNNDDFWPF